MPETYPDNAPWKDPETLREMRLEDRMSLKEIGDEFGVTKATVHRWVTKFGLDKEPPKGSYKDYVG